MTSSFVPSGRDGNRRDDDKDALIPGWGVSADTQIIVLGVLVVALVLGATFLWPRIFGTDSPLPANVEAISPDNPTASIAPPAAGAAAGTSSTTTTRSTNVLGNELSPAVAAAVSSFDGITGSANGDIAILSGFVGTQSEKDQAGAAALALEGINEVDNSLVVLADAVAGAATANGVSDSTVEMDGTSATIRGVVSNQLESEAALAAIRSVRGVTGVTGALRILQPEVAAAVDALGTVGEGESAVETRPGDPVGRVAILTGNVSSEEAKAQAEAAASSVDGITGVDNKLLITGPTAEEVATDLNDLFELEPIQFVSASPRIQDASLPTLDRAVELLREAAGDVKLEVQGFTDTSGGEAFNQSLSEDRAEAVRQYLVDNGVAADSLTSKGFGETTEFGEDPAANRRVRFVLQ